MYIHTYNHRSFPHLVMTWSYIYMYPKPRLQQLDRYLALQILVILAGILSKLELAIFSTAFSIICRVSYMHRGPLVSSLSCCRKSIILALSLFYYHELFMLLIN
jgi:hypothetical protein